MNENTENKKGHAIYELSSQEKKKKKKIGRWVCVSGAKLASKMRDTD